MKTEIEKIEKNNDPVMKYVLKEVSKEPEMFNEANKILQLLFNGRIISADVILICAYVALKIRKKEIEKAGNYE